MVLQPSAAEASIAQTTCNGGSRRTNSTQIAPAERICKTCQADTAAAKGPSNASAEEAARAKVVAPCPARHASAQQLTSTCLLGYECNLWPVCLWLASLLNCSHALGKALPHCSLLWDLCGGLQAPRAGRVCMPSALMLCRAKGGDNQRLFWCVAAET